MPEISLIKNCHSTRGFRIPSEPNIRAKWLKILKVNRNITKRSFVCDKHFTKNDIKYFNEEFNRKMMRRKLKSGVVPSVNLEIYDKTFKSQTHEHIIMDDLNLKSDAVPFVDIEIDDKTFRSQTAKYITMDNLNLTSHAVPSVDLEIDDKTFQSQTDECADNLDCGNETNSDNGSVDSNFSYEICSPVHDNEINSSNDDNDKDISCFCGDDSVSFQDQNTSNGIKRKLHKTVSTQTEIHVKKDDYLIRIRGDDSESVQDQIKSDKIKRKFSTTVSTQTESIHVKTASCQTLVNSALSFDKLKRNDAYILYYTGLESAKKVRDVFNCLGPAAYGLNYMYGNVLNISVIDQFIITLIKLRRATSDVELAILFECSKKIIQNIVITWIGFMYMQWKDLNIWPSKECILYYMPAGFKKETDNSTRIIIDGTEFPISSSKNPVHQEAAFRTWKNRSTLENVNRSKPGGLSSHISPSYRSSIGYREIIERGDLMEKCEPNDSILADRGIKVNISTSLKLPGLCIEKVKKLVNSGVYIERAIDLAKTYKILKHELPSFYIPLGSRIFFICCILCTFRKNIVNDDTK